MEKVAICLHGHIRSWEKCKPHFMENIYGVVPNPDVFIHTFDEQTNGSEVKFTNDDIKAMFSDMNVKSLVIEKMSEVCDCHFEKAQTYLPCDHGVKCPNHTFKIYSVFRKINDLYDNMKSYATENKIEYSKIIFCRLDALPKTLLDIKQVVDPTKLYNYYSGSPEPCDELVILLPFMAELFGKKRFLALDKIENEHTYMGACPLDYHLIIKYCMIRDNVDFWPVSLGLCEVVK